MRMALALVVVAVMGGCKTRGKDSPVTQAAPTGTAGSAPPGPGHRALDPRLSAQ